MDEWYYLQVATAFVAVIGLVFIFKLVAQRTMNGVRLNAVGMTHDRPSIISRQRLDMNYTIVTISIGRQVFRVLDNGKSMTVLSTEEQEAIPIKQVV